MGRTGRGALDHHPPLPATLFERRFDAFGFALRRGKPAVALAGALRPAPRLRKTGSGRSTPRLGGFEHTLSISPFFNDIIQLGWKLEPTAAPASKRTGS